MHVIALIAQKGGVGKTTIAIHLATAFAAEGRATLILDLDPQASATEWKDHRATEFPAVLSIQPSRLGKVMEEAKSIGTEILILDTAPHSEGTSLEAARASRVEFDYEESFAGELGPSAIFDLDPDTLFLSDPAKGGMDYALVAVAPNARPESQQPGLTLDDFGYNVLQ